MENTVQQSIRGSTLPQFQFMFFISALLALSTWVLDISIWKSVSIVLAIVVAVLIFSVLALADRIARLEKSRQYRLTRIYDQAGNEVMNKWTDQLDFGHWVTITTDVLNHKILYAEHTRTDENTSALGREKCISEEHEYNKSMIWGSDYKRTSFRRRVSLKSRLSATKT